MTTLEVSPRFQGLAGIGQGGYLGGRLAELVARPAVRVGFRCPIPLGVEMQVREDHDRLELWWAERLVAEAGRMTLSSSPPDPATPEQAEVARQAAEASYPAELGGCFSCGRGDDALRIHAGPLDDGRFASPYLPPDWSDDGSGAVALPFLWAPLDCAAGWRTSFGEDGRPALTGWLAAEVVEQVAPDTPLVVVADADPGWDGRKRVARSALYTEHGELVARAESLWISIPGWHSTS